MLLALPVVAVGCSHRASQDVGTAYGTPADASEPGYAPSEAGYGGGAAPPAQGYAEAESYAEPSMDMAGADAEMARDTPRSRREEAKQSERPGLGTAYGETRQSEVRGVGFERRRNRPETVLTLWYDDYAGVEAAAHRRGGRRPDWSYAGVDEGGLRAMLLDEWGNPLSGADASGRQYAVGEPGARYLLGIENQTGERWEVVASVDGLDVVDGQDASYKKRGYVIEPWSSVQIDGWRTSDSTVAAFRFSSVSDSYAGRTGKARNVGVVGFAFFAEDHAQPRYAPPPPPDYDRQRDRANPFPGR